MMNAGVPHKAEVMHYLHHSFSNCSLGEMAASPTTVDVLTEQRKSVQTNRIHQAVIAGLTAVLMSGCSGVALTQGSSFQPLDPMSRANEDAVARFEIHWPAKRTQLQPNRRPSWISASAASVVIQITGDANGTEIVNAPKDTEVNP